MGGHVVRPFGVGGEAREEGLQVAAHAGIGVLAEDERGAGVRQEDGDGPTANAAGGDGALHVGRDVGGAAAAGAEFEGRLVDHGFSSAWRTTAIGSTIPAMPTPYITASALSRRTPGLPCSSSRRKRGATRQRRAARMI